MKVKYAIHRAARKSGFTLIEIVITLILLSIFAALLIQMISTAIKESSQPIAAIQAELALIEIMEKMTADYKWILLTDQTPLATFETRIENGNNPASTPYFGSYELTSKYINFSPDGTSYKEKTEACTTDCKTLKVTIRRNDLHLTTLFTK